MWGCERRPRPALLCPQGMRGLEGAAGVPGPPGPRVGTPRAPTLLGAEQSAVSPTRWPGGRAFVGWRCPGPSGTRVPRAPENRSGHPGRGSLPPTGQVGGEQRLCTQMPHSGQMSGFPAGLAVAPGPSVLCERPPQPPQPEGWRHPPRLRSALRGRGREAQPGGSRLGTNHGLGLVQRSGDPGSPGWRAEGPGPWVCPEPPPLRLGRASRAWQGPGAPAGSEDPQGLWGPR